MPVVLYSALRLALLVVVWLVLLAFHVSGILAFAIAIVLALLLSYLVFRGPRDAAGRYMAERARRRHGGPSRISGSIDADDAAEDALVDAMDAPDSDLEDEPSPQTESSAQTTASVQTEDAAPHGNGPAAGV